MMNMCNIGLNIDGVIVDFQLAWHKLYSEIPSNPDDYDKNIHQRVNDMRDIGWLLWKF